ncbi:uncharacterized protein LOC141613989 [Silene latifolia]|uniref:uncharacterized protein LOC141613989 n=1 Tax=Silene latifolia TaxID=37657 RepID=UPI003D789FEF
MRGVMRFEKKGKLSQMFIGPYEILDRVGELAYRLALPPDLDRFHNVFHVSQLRKFVSVPSHVLEVENIELKTPPKRSAAYIQASEMTTDDVARMIVQQEAILKALKNVGKGGLRNRWTQPT